MKKNKDLILLEEIDKMRSMMGLLNEYAYPAVTKGIEEFFEYIFGRGTFDHVALGEKIKRFEESLTEFDKNLTLSKKLNYIGRKVEQGFQQEGRNLLITLFSCDRQKLILISGTNTLELMLLKKYLI